MRIVAGETRKLAIAVAKARGAMEVGGLVPDVPGVAPVSFVIQIARLAMTGAAELVEFSRR
jgi:hypothetical protein